MCDYTVSKCTYFLAVFDLHSWDKWQSNQLCTNYFLSGPQQLKSAWTFWWQPCGIGFTLDSTLDKTTAWIKYMSGCPTDQRWQLYSSAHIILTRLLTDFLLEIKWNTCRYHYCHTPLWSQTCCYGIHVFPDFNLALNSQLVLKMSKQIQMCAV